MTCRRGRKSRRREDGVWFIQKGSLHPLLRLVSDHITIPLPPIGSKIKIMRGLKCLKVLKSYFKFCIKLMLNFTTLGYFLSNICALDVIISQFLHMQRNWVFVTNYDFLISISLQPNAVDLRYFKLWILLDERI